MIAYFILAHRYPKQFKRLFKAIYHTSNYYLVHVDKKSGLELQAEIHNFLKSYPNASMLKSENALWGGFSLVDAELRGIKKLLDKDLHWDFFINLSAQDFPLKSQKTIMEFLDQNKGKDFMKVLDQRKFRPDTLSRIENYVTESGENIAVSSSSKRPFLQGVIPYIGNQWMILSRRFCEFVIRSPEVERYREFYQHTFIADEGFFQTVFMNTSYKGILVNDDKRAIDWVPMGEIKLRPRDFLSKDANYLMRSQNLFARKFDENVDANILNILECHISQSSALSEKLLQHRAHTTSALAASDG